MKKLLILAALAVSVSGLNAAKGKKSLNKKNGRMTVAKLEKKLEMKINKCEKHINYLQQLISDMKKQPMIQEQQPMQAVGSAYATERIVPKNVYSPAYQQRYQPLSPVGAAIEAPIAAAATVTEDAANIATAPLRAIL